MRQQPIPPAALTLVEGTLSPHGRQILAWLAAHRAELDQAAMAAAPEPYWWCFHQAAAALGLRRPRLNQGEYLGYAIQEIVG